ncbi:N-acetylglucosaminyldiphosphoundecaprenol N-acetyl-beta-D-mannosaminyltransferase [Lentibacillus persicus]|uniref:N-acetylglucosaminyldiphosphoundecaprenol N-acetyl-beta-D-mannosaminyltransferase n=1 Tax=Lentibacillus persicus TaxID=640948 RepID=A0A1I1XVJ8_9BACI|nr:WecB/TagA/CpsF family glycosyltransferase [Lentibacillus persicus]SFE11324.1 N-acetylglucosaminyldiphosphoundecaprenol N-acetyl-beta-D-mannosaminyltransferase [Lentibacillus persicus]
MNDTITIMDIDFVNTTQKELLQNHIAPRLEAEKKSFIVTANPEIVMQTREDPRYKKSVQSADYVTPDGVGVLMAAKYLKLPLKERIAGYDLMLDLLQYANEHKLSCYFLGAKEEVNEKAVAEVKKQFPAIHIAGRHHGYFDIDDETITSEIERSKADLVFVALGLPRQELWISRHIDKFSKGLFMGVGGSLDGLAGTFKRAPDIWIKLNLEWLYRLLKQPTRFKRILKVFEFMFRIIFRKST